MMGLSGTEAFDMHISERTAGDRRRLAGLIRRERDAEQQDMSLSPFSVLFAYQSPPLLLAPPVYVLIPPMKPGLSSVLSIFG